MNFIVAQIIIEDINI